MLRWAERIDPAVRDWWPVVLVVGFNQLGLGETGWTGVGPIVPALLGLAFALPLRWRREQPLWVLAAITVAVTVAALSVPGQPPFASFVAVMVACFALGQHARLRLAVAGLAVPALPVAVLAALDATATPQELVFPVFYFGAAWGAGRLVRRRQELARRMAGLVAALEQQQEDNARLAAEAERHRIAREVHDTVAHSLGVILIQAEAAQELLERRGRPDRPVEVIQSTARATLEELRGVLGAMRGDEPAAQPGLAALDALVERFRRAGVEVSLQVDGVSQVPAAVDAAAYRLVQEGLTNVLRHARGAAAAIRVSSNDEGLLVRVRDDGDGSPIDPRLVGSGYGLAGMRERVARLGGELVVGPLEGGGFGVEARLPLRGALR
jgi:signal transduction histidine kinase